MSTFRTLLLSLALVACRESARRESTPREATASADPYAPATMIVAFRARVPERPTTLDGAPSVDSLLARYVRGVEARDTAALRPLAMTASEFAWLYYLDSPMAQKPYELDPDAMWTQISAQSTRGLARALERLGGRPLGAWRAACAPPRVAGALRLHDCTVSAPDVALRLSVVERDGRFKLVGFGTSL